MLKNPEVIVADSVLLQPYFNPILGGEGQICPPTGFYKINAKRLKVWIWNLLTLNKIL